jgi:DNA-binding response OmpR family regulator
MVRAEKSSPDPYLPIILLSGFTDPKQIRIARNMGVNEILAKPFSPEALYGRLTSIVRQPRPFFETVGYFGPDRRRRKTGVVEPYRRRRDKR